MLRKFIQKTKPEEQLPETETKATPVEGMVPHGSQPPTQPEVNEGITLPSSKRRLPKLTSVVLVLLLTFALGTLSGYLYFRQTQMKSPPSVPSGQEDPYLSFLLEIYDKIKENYWDKISDENLTTIFKLGAEKLSGNPTNLKTLNREEIKNSLLSIIKNLDDKKKKEFSVNLANIVLANLSPFGRSGLYTTKQETSLKNNVANINPEKNLYQDIGLSKGATPEEIQKSYQKIKPLLESQKEGSPEAQRKLDALNYAYGVLSDEGKKDNYDKLGVEPTVTAKILTKNIFYLPIQKISPTTFDEVQREIGSIKTTPSPNTLIIDLRGNIGGSIDLLPYLLGPFIGQNQYAYEFFHQGQTDPLKTKTGFLPALIPFKKVLILTDNQTQSSAEVIVATLKKYNVGVTIGTTTKGWGTVEKVFALDHQIDQLEKYSMFLVHSLTLREDGQPIEGKGVDPLININDPTWEKQLSEFFDSPEIIQTVRSLVTNK